MAKIVIKQREDAIFIENERAQKIKDRWLDENVPRTTMVEISHGKGSWCGTLGSIASIDIEKDIPKPKPVPIVQETMTPEKKREALARIRAKVAELGLSKKI